MSSFIDNAFKRVAERNRERTSVYDFNDEYDVDPVRMRYGTSDADVTRATELKEYELTLQNQEAAIMGQRLSNTKLLAEEAYKQRQRMETDAQLTDAYGALGEANTPAALADISVRYAAATRSEDFKNAFAERKALFDSRATAEVEAAKLGVLPQFTENVERNGGVDAMDPSRALASAVDSGVERSTRGVLEAAGVEIPMTANGVPDRVAMDSLRAQIDSRQLESEERQFVLEKWKSLTKVLDSEVERQLLGADGVAEARRERAALETILDPRSRSARNNARPEAPNPGSPNDDYFAP